jgi:exopolysaccharide biosynthesis polyprenyl glycosylphosphotransferase
MSISDAPNATTADAPPSPRISNGGTPQPGHGFPRFIATRQRFSASAVPMPEVASTNWPPMASEQALRVVARRERVYRWMLAFADAISATAALVLSMTLIGTDSLQPEFVVIVPLIIIAAKIQGLYDRDDLLIHKSTLDEFPRLVNLATMFAMLTWLGRHFIVDGAPTTEQLLALWLLLVTMLAGTRAAARAIAGGRLPVERCLLVGGETLHRRLKPKFRSAHATLVGCISVGEVAHDHAALVRLATELDVHRVVIAPSDQTDPEITMDLVRGAAATGLRVSLLPGLIGAVGNSVAFDDLGGVPLLGVPGFGLTRSSRAIKRAFDLVGASFALLLAAPLMAVIAIAIKRSSPGAILFRQTRVGRDGRHFRVLKFRTMVDGADEMKNDLLGRNEASGIFKMANDPRVTPLGRMLRSTSLDELPQLFNVLRGDMSLVGPRPLVLDEDELITGYDRQRLHLTPGMTGRWQTLGSARVPLSEMVRIDYLYVANWSLWLDVKVLLRTIAFVLRRRGM